ncbi:hypothetical protein [Aeromicrobium choanae]|uniref:Uncharacterized protein n=1 Tax=Aeromicrobium choanae TaxID=1736691 RepID=A0A1T4Z969_9ACTN|nr:hypothetical protein [Aeromicrobium choanae]SKB10413.1 hypothetical protein SAMN06295964_3318 [Aeromicrobium choanae]
MPTTAASTDGVELFWIPLGAGPGGQVVRTSGRIYEALVAARERRARVDLFHSALIVRLDGHDHAIEMAPVWSLRVPDRGVVSEGPVGFHSAGRLRLFRYEVRCWRDGFIPDVRSAVGGPKRVSTGSAPARRVLDAVPSFPTATWGRDELRAGEMWNSNSLTSWLLRRSGHDLGDLHPPGGGRAPGWDAGGLVAHRDLPESSMPTG